MWASVATLFTSPSLFVFVNIVIVTIVLISRLSASHRKPETHHQHQLGSDLPRRLLERVKSIDFSIYTFIPTNSEPEFYQPNQLVRAPSLLHRVKSFNFSFPKFSPENYQEEEASSNEPDYYPPAQPEPAQQLSPPPSLLERFKSDPGQVKTSKSEGKGTMRKVNKEKMKKSASVLFRREEAEGGEELERRRPATMNAEKKTAVGEAGDVDAKADDFINRFKKQLRLQRLDSILRS